jgi:putative membrane protein
MMSRSALWPRPQKISRAKWSRFAAIKGLRRTAMRWVYLAVVVLFAIAVLVFALQNLEVVTVSLLRFEMRLPLAVLTIVVYILGAFTGGGLLALLRRSYERSEWSFSNRA